LVTLRRLVELEKVNDEEPANELLSLNCTCVSLPPGVPEPPLPVTHVPSIEKQPSVISMPLANVDVALVPLRLRYGACMPPEKVEVPVPVTVREVAETLVPEMEPPVIVESESVMSSSSSIRSAPPTAL